MVPTICYPYPVSQRVEKIKNTYITDFFVKVSQKASNRLGSKSFVNFVINTPN